MNPQKPIEVQCEVQSFRQITPSVFELTFSMDKEVTFDGGQFVSIVIPGAGPSGRDIRRAYSIASGAEQRPVELCVKLVDGGPGTSFLNQLRPGDRFRSFAPYGHFVYKPKSERDAVFISTGTGIAPFRSMVLSEKYRNEPPRKAFCLFGSREEEELLYDHEFSAIPGLAWVPCITKPTASWGGFKGRVTDYLRKSTEIEWSLTEFYLCGSGAMIDEVKSILSANGVTKDSIHQEIYYKTPKGDGVSSEATGTEGTAPSK